MTLKIVDRHVFPAFEESNALYAILSNRTVLDDVLVSQHKNDSPAVKKILLVGLNGDIGVTRTDNTECLAVVGPKFGDAVVWRISCFVNVEERVRLNVAPDPWQFRNDVRVPGLPVLLKFFP